MSHLEKWRFYVEKLGSAEEKLRGSIVDWRKYKKAISRQKYEERVPDLRYQMFNFTPNEMIFQINKAKIQTEFYRIKIDYYKELEQNGETLQNQAKLRQLNTKAAQYMASYDYLGEI